MSPPSSDDMSRWKHYSAVVAELQELQNLISKVKSLGSAIGTAGHIERTSTAGAVARCQPFSARGGSQVEVGGHSLSVLDHVRTCNRLTRAQNRNLGGRYQTMNHLKATLVKVSSARQAGEDVAVGSNILTVFQGDSAKTGVSFVFFVGQVRQINAATHSGRRQQRGISVADADASALMVCSPWAAVDAYSGRLLFSEEPAEYYGLKQIVHELHDCDDEDADLPAENTLKSKYNLAPLLMKHVQVDWKRWELVDVQAVVKCISQL
jgi:hypothetical protein